jgi:hypothetical protein
MSYGAGWTSGGTMTAEPRGCTAGPRSYTVFGVIDHDTGELHVAGVIEGAHRALGDAPTQTTQYGRYATTVEAASADEAEQFAVDAFGFGRERSSP